MKSNIKQKCALWHNNYTPRYLPPPKRWKHITYPQKDLYKFAHNRRIYICQILNTVQVSVIRRVNKWSVVWSHNRMLLGNWKKQITNTHKNMDRSNHCTEWIEQGTKEHILSDSTYMKFKTRQASQYWQSS